jgi:hypothetical protein
VSGEVTASTGHGHGTGGSGHGTVQYGPTKVEETQAFTAGQLTRMDEALTLSSRETGLVFSVYVGELSQPTRAHAEALFERLTGDSVLLAISPGQRTLHIVTGPESAQRLPNRACALAALAMRAAFANGDLTGGIVTGLRMLADSAGTH